MKTVYEHGINDVPGASKYRWYKIWKEMLRRCYDLKLIRKYPTYTGCTVDDNWLYLSNFKKWYEDQGDVDHLFLDKDFLYPGNKLYSKDNCVLIPNGLNGVITKSDAIRGQYPIGVVKKSNRYVARCKNRKELITVGSYLTPEDAYAAYCDYKIVVLKSYIPEIQQLNIKEKMKQKIIIGIHNQVQLLASRNYK